MATVTGNGSSRRWIGASAGSAAGPLALIGDLGAAQGNACWRWPMASAA